MINGLVYVFNWLVSYEVLGSNLWATKMLEGLKSQLVEFVMEKQSFFALPS